MPKAFHLGGFITCSHQKKPLKCGRIEFGVFGFKINLNLGRLISEQIMIM